MQIIIWLCSSSSIQKPTCQGSLAHHSPVAQWLEPSGYITGGRGFKSHSGLEFFSSFLLRWSLRNKSCRTIFFKLSLNVPYQALFSKRKDLNRKRILRVWSIFIYDLWNNQTIQNDSDLKRYSSRCFALSSNHFVHTFSCIFFLSEKFSPNFFIK